MIGIRGEWPQVNTANFTPASRIDIALLSVTDVEAHPFDKYAELGLLKEGPIKENQGVGIVNEDVSIEGSSSLGDHPSGNHAEAGEVSAGAGVFLRAAR